MGNGLDWLTSHQELEGWWQAHSAEPSPPDPQARVSAERGDRMCVASLALLALLESGAPDRYLAQLRSGLRYLVACSPADAPPPVAATLCAAARVLDEPECRAAAHRAIAAIASRGEPEPDPGWRSLALLEAEFAGVLFDPDLHRLIDVREPALPTKDAELRFFAARARWYAGAAPLALDAWDETAPSLGPAHETACFVLCSEAASGLAHPLTMPLPDAPQLKAAVATLRIAAQSKDQAIRAAAEQALAGFR